MNIDAKFFVLHSYRFKLRVLGIQLDNQLPLTPMPVLFRPQRFEGQSDYVLKFSVTMQSNGAIDLCAYPYIGLQVIFEVISLWFLLLYKDIDMVHFCIMMVVTVCLVGP